jgi:lipoprotein-anchoring transpeptidase ErfK/SrfK
MASPSIAATAKAGNSVTQSAKPKAPSDAEKPFKLKKKVAKADKGKKKAPKQDELSDADKAAAKKLVEKEKAKAKEAAAEKAREAKKLAMRAKAKADAEARREAARSFKPSRKPVELASAEPVQPIRPIEVSLKNKPVTGMTAERIAAQEAAAVGADLVVRQGNNGELRSETVAARPNNGFFEVLFGDEQPMTASMLPETRALDAVLETKKKFKPKAEYEPQSVQFSGYPRGSIVIDTEQHFLYYVESGSSARRYGIAVGREGLQFKGQVAVGDKQEWPRWIPTLDMQKREPKKYGQYKDGMPGGGQNPLGARAIYLYQGKSDTHLRIHGTIAPQSIGTNSSNGCFRMINDHVIDLYSRVRVGTPVIIL